MGVYDVPIASRSEEDVNSALSQVGTRTVSLARISTHLVELAGVSVFNTHTYRAAGSVATMSNGPGSNVPPEPKTGYAYPPYGG